MKVHVVYVEYNVGRDEPYIVGVFADKEAADKAGAAEARTHSKEYNNDVWARDPETGEVNDDQPDD